MHQNAFGGRAPPGPAGGAYSAPPDPLAGFKGLLLMGGERRGGEWKGREKGRGGGMYPLTNILDPPLCFSVYKFDLCWFTRMLFTNTY